MQNESKKIAVFGIGYVGSVTAACLAKDGHTVVGVDIDAGKVAEINSGKSPVGEPGLDDLTASVVAAGRFRATTSVKEAIDATDMALVAIGTPSSDDGSVDLRSLQRAIGAIGEALRGTTKKYTIVLRSTLLPGLLEDTLRPIVESASQRSCGNELALCNNPEFLREGSAIKDYYHPPFIIVGADDQAVANDVMGMYDVIDCERIVCDTRTAAMLKYACNAFHALKVSFANEMGALSKALGANGHQVLDLLTRDTKLNISTAYMRPGFAFGGSCLPKDLRALARYAQQHAVDARLMPAILDANESQIKRAIKLIRSHQHRKIGIIGLSFKSGTDDLRESPMVTLAEQLIGTGYDVRIFDPGVMLSRIRGLNLAYVDQHLPHLASLLVPQARNILDHAQLLVVCTDVAANIPWADQFRGPIVDLRRDLA